MSARADHAIMVQARPGVDDDALADLGVDIDDRAGDDKAAGADRRPRADDRAGMDDRGQRKAKFAKPLHPLDSKRRFADRDERLRRLGVGVRKSLACSGDRPPGASLERGPPVVIECDVRPASLRLSAVRRDLSVTAGAKNEQPRRAHDFDSLLEPWNLGMVASPS